jgi:hypothetical protein
MSSPSVRLAKYHNPTSRMSTPKKSDVLRPRSSCLGCHAGPGGGGGVDAGGVQPGGGGWAGGVDGATGGVDGAAGGVGKGVRVVLVSSESVMVSLRFLVAFLAILAAKGWRGIRLATADAPQGEASFR